MHNKKAAVVITIETIVIIILATIFLGLSLMIVGYIFHEMGINVTDMFLSIQQQRIQTLKLSEESFDIEWSVLEIGPDNKKTIFMLFRNPGASEKAVWTLNHKIFNISSGTDCNNILLSYNKDVTVNNKDEVIQPLIIQTNKNITTGTCLFEMQAADSSNMIKTQTRIINLK
jgi:hypothetical protein